MWVEFSQGCGGRKKGRCELWRGGGSIHIRKAGQAWSRGRAAGTKVCREVRRTGGEARHGRLEMMVS